MIANCTATGADTSVHVNTKLFDAKELKTMHGEIKVEKIIHCFRNRKGYVNLTDMSQGKICIVLLCCCYNLNSISGQCYSG